MPTPTGTLDHHFLEGRRYHVAQREEDTAITNWWRRAFFAAAGIIVLLVLGCVYLGSLPKYVPFLVHQDRGSGELWAARPAVQADFEQPKSLEYWLRELIVCLRGVSTDKEIMRQLWVRHKARMTPKGRKLFVQYESEWKPLEQKDPVRVQILHIFRRTAKTYDVRWQETQFSGDSKSEVLRKEVYLGLVTFEVRPPTFAEKDDNPGGVFFDFWQWSRE